MEGFIINIIGTLGFSVTFLTVFFSIYYLYLKGVGGKVQEDGKREEDKIKGRTKRLGKRILK